MRISAQDQDKDAFATIFVLNRKARDPATMPSTLLSRVTDMFDRLKTADAEKRLAALQAAHPEETQS